MTAAGYCHVTGVGLAFLQRARVVVGLALDMFSALLLIADGARWIRSFFPETLRAVTQKTMILDWHYLRQRCLELASRICRGNGQSAGAAAALPPVVA